MRAIPCLLALGVLLAACDPPAPPSGGDAPEPPAAAAANAGSQLAGLIEAEWERTLHTAPTLATFLGDARYNDRWEDVSLASRAAANAADREDLAALLRIDRGALSADDRIDHDLFRLRLEARIEDHALGGHLMPVNQLDGVQLMGQMAEFAPFATQRDYENWLRRLQGLGTLVDQTIALMRRGMEVGRLPPRLVVERVLPQVQAQQVTRPADSAFFKPFLEYPEAVPPEIRGQLSLAGESAVMDGVVPAYARLQKFLETEYLPACPTAVGLSAQPQGAALYAARVRLHTTTTLTPDEIHAVGQSEVTRIHEAMKAVLKELNWTGGQSLFFNFLRTDGRFRYSDPERLLDRYRAIAKRIDPELPRLFGRLPRMPYGVKAISELAAASAPSAYYYPPAADGSRAGYFHANTHRPESRNTWEMEVLTAHEAVPGHHLQIALAQELDGLPAFRRYAGDYSAYVEGWGLYAESLGYELGLYKDPYSRFGQLIFERWRAVRLVVDTGLHHKGWTREQAIDYFKARVPKSAADIEVEVDRYIAYPGQALAYKIGELRIQALRKRAAERLDERFDIRAFHDVVLGSGPLPLDVLDQQVEAWIARQAGLPP